MAKILAIIVLFLITVIAIIALTQEDGEGFANKAEKHKALNEWFKKESNPTFTKFKNTFTGASDLVEFEEWKNKTRDLTKS